MKIPLLILAIFNLISSFVWMYLDNLEKAINRTDFAIIFFALYFIISKIEKDGQSSS